MSTDGRERLLEIQAVGRVFRRGGARVTAVKAMSLAIGTSPARWVTLAGESGCGKSTLALMALGFLAPSSGRLLYGGEDIYRLRGDAARNFRREVQAVFQDPFEVFNPFYRIDHSFALALRLLERSRGATDRRAAVRTALLQVQLDPESVLGRYPHQLSGGQLQRIAIARAILLQPRLLIADEPVSMIDASLRVLVLRELLDLKQRLGVSILYITHDLSTALQVSDEILIAREGEIVERGEARAVIETPQHPYTRQLIDAIPVPDPHQHWSSHGH
jgi:ABC-type oligopeptide transport system ATPase subunit